jgi:hypothetical protein
MGIDFIKKAAPFFRKGVDRDRIQLATPTLFTTPPKCEARTYAVRLRQDKSVREGEKLGVRLSGRQILVLRGIDLVGTLNTQNEPLEKALTESFGEACATVQAVHMIARIAEVSLC